MTALHIAAEEGHVKIVEELLRVGCDVDVISMVSILVNLFTI